MGEYCKINLGQVRDIEDRGERKQCMAGCNDQTLNVALSSSGFPEKGTYVNGKTFCLIIRYSPLN